MYHHLDGQSDYSLLFLAKGWSSFLKVMGRPCLGRGRGNSLMGSARSTCQSYPLASTTNMICIMANSISVICFSLALTGSAQHVCLNPAIGLLCTAAASVQRTMHGTGGRNSAELSHRDPLRLAKHAVTGNTKTHPANNGDQRAS